MIRSRRQIEAFLAREVLGRAPSRKPPARERRGPVRDPRYLAWIRTLDCLACGRSGPSEAAHYGDHGISQKASDHQTLPLCADCHRLSPASYHRLGRRAWERRWGVACDSAGRELFFAFLSQTA